MSNTGNRDVGIEEFRNAKLFRELTMNPFNFAKEVEAEIAVTPVKTSREFSNLLQDYITCGLENSRKSRQIKIFAQSLSGR
jgi:hypothetical protein